MKAAFVLILVSTVWTGHFDRLDAQRHQQHMSGGAGQHAVESAISSSWAHRQDSRLRAPTLAPRMEHRQLSSRRRLDATAARQTSRRLPVIGAFVGLGAGVGVATYQMSESDDGPDPVLLLYLPAGALTGWLVGHLFE